MNQLIVIAGGAIAKQQAGLSQQGLVFVTMMSMTTARRAGAGSPQQHFGVVQGHLEPAFPAGCVVENDVVLITVQNADYHAREV